MSALKRLSNRAHRIPKRKWFTDWSKEREAGRVLEGSMKR
jgi:hypothetical protein